MSNNTKEDILNATYILIAEQGIQKASFAQIAKAVGISKPSIYYYFESKDDLIKQLFEYFCKEIQFTNYFRVEEFTAENFEGKLVKVGIQMIKYQKQDPYYDNVMKEFLSLAARESNNKEQLQKARQSILKRALLLFILGIGLYAIGWTGDILHYYGFYLFLLAFFIGFKKGTNIIIAGFIILIAQAIQLTYDMFTGWQPNALFMEYVDFWSISGFTRNLFINGYHPIFPWFAFILIGFVIGSYSLKDWRIQRNLLAIGFTSLVIAESASFVLINN